ncbi:MAG: hypothetical protein ACYTGB_17110, partial [Planctomycetota bacterium]
VGGKCLEWHSAEPGTLQTARLHPWDVIALQQQTHPFGGYEPLAAAYERLAPHLEKSGAEILLYVTWRSKHAPESNQAELTEAFERLGAERSLRVVPVGPAWARCRVEHPEIELYHADESHASPAGSYLGACCFFAVLTGESPAGLPGRIEVRGDTLVDLDEATAAALQKTAEAATDSAAG